MYEYIARIVSIYDADTIKMNIDCGFNIWMKNENVRLARINAPEVRGEERPKGLEARDWLRNYLSDGKEIRIKTMRDKKGKYGRYIAEVYADGKNVNDLLVEKGFAIYQEY